MKFSIKNILGVSALVAGSIFAAALTASPAAAAPTCVTYPNPPEPHSDYQTWPLNAQTTGSSASNLYDCVVPANDPLFVDTYNQAKGVANTGNSSLAQQWSTAQVRVYVFKNLKGLNQTWQTSFKGNKKKNVVNAVTAAVGQSPVLSVIAVGVLETNTAGTKQTEQRVQQIVNHELGHVVDDYYGFPSGNTSSTYRHNLQADIDNFNNLPRAEALVYYTVTEACNAKPENWEVVQCLDKSGTTDLELFANIFGEIQSDGILDGPLGKTINNFFTNTKMVMVNVQNGISPN